MAIVQLTADGRKIVSTPIPGKSSTGAGNLSWTLQVEELARVDYIMQFNLNTDPVVLASPSWSSITGNTVGVTMVVGNTTTLSGELITLGF